MHYSIALNRFFPFHIFSRSGAEHNLSALKKGTLINPCFIADEWQEWKFRYPPVFVGFLYTVVSSVPSGFLLNRFFPFQIFSRSGAEHYLSALGRAVHHFPFRYTR